MRMSESTGSPLNLRDRRRIRRRRFRRATEPRPVSARELSLLTSHDGDGYAIEFDESADRSAVLDGHINMEALGVDLLVHTSDAVELESACIDVMVPPSLTVAVMLEGQVEASLDGTFLGMRASPANAGCVWMHRHPARLRRRVQAGARVRKVHISVTPESLDQLLRGSGNGSSTNAVSDWLQGDGVVQAAWTPSHQALRLAESILEAERDKKLFYRLSAGIGALNILLEALGALLDSRRASDALPVNSRDATRAYRARQHIGEHLDGDISLPGIAAATGMSVSTLQRVFKTTFGQTVIDYVRAERLEAARTALWRGDLTVGEAAYRAGYKSASNFSTAFRQAYGYPPSHCRMPTRTRELSIGS